MSVSVQPPSALIGKPETSFYPNFPGALTAADVSSDLTRLPKLATAENWATYWQRQFGSAGGSLASAVFGLLQSRDLHPEDGILDLAGLKRDKKDDDADAINFVFDRLQAGTPSEQPILEKMREQILARRDQLATLHVVPHNGQWAALDENGFPFAVVGDGWTQAAAAVMRRYPAAQSIRLVMDTSVYQGRTHDPLNPNRTDPEVVGEELAKKMAAFSFAPAGMLVGGGMGTWGKDGGMLDLIPYVRITKGHSSSEPYHEHIDVWVMVAAAGLVMAAALAGKRGGGVPPLAFETGVRRPMTGGGFALELPADVLAALNEAFGKQGVLSPSVYMTAAAEGQGSVSVRSRIGINELMEQSGVKFGTSGARGLVNDMSDYVCYAYTTGFIRHLESLGELQPGMSIAIAGDLRPSTDRIMTAVGRAITDSGYAVLNDGKIPSPAVVVDAMAKGIPSIMVTGSHIPVDRNGIKFNRARGEVTKDDEVGMKQQVVEIPEGLFDGNGMFVEGASRSLPEVNATARDIYLQRYLGFFPEGFLKGRRIGVYGHSAVGRDILVELLEGLGAEVIRLGFSDKFIPVDTEAIRPEDVALAKEWVKQHKLFAIVSTDGDSDRPLVAGADGKWFRGDVLGILVAKSLEADAVAVPVSCNSALEESGLFGSVARTKIGSPYVDAAMRAAVDIGARLSVGWEANGGFLTASNIVMAGQILTALPTRDAVLPILGALHLAVRSGLSVEGLLDSLPPRVTASGLLKEFQPARSKQVLGLLATAEGQPNIAAMERYFGEAFGKVTNVDRTDGTRMTFEGSKGTIIVHLRPSGNAPEFRVYTEAATEETAEWARQAAQSIVGNMAFTVP